MLDRRLPRRERTTLSQNVLCLPTEQERLRFCYIPQEGARATKMAVIFELIANHQGDALLLDTGYGWHPL